MKKMYKVTAKYENALGLTVVTSRTVSEKRLDEILHTESIQVISVNGVPGANYYRKVAQ